MIRSCIMKYTALKMKKVQYKKSHVCLKCLNIKDFFSAHVSSPLGQDVFFEEKTIMFAISLGILFNFRVCNDKKNSIATEIQISKSLFYI